MSKTKLKRWESQSDKIFVISLDASPDTIWQGTLKDLKAKSPAFWKERFVARTDYAFCTDVTSAFRLAAKYLEGDSRYISKYLFVFSDLIHEPPTGNMRSCQFPVKVSPDDFPWSTLSDVSVSIFWLPTTQKLLWRKAIQEHGMEANFSLYTTSESSTVAIPELPRPQEKVTAADRKAQQAQIKNAVASSLLWIFVLIIVFSLLIICGFIFQRYRRRDAPVFNNNRRPIPVPPRPWPGNRPRTPVIPKKRS
jgi:hypothetical protein